MSRNYDSRIHGAVIAIYIYLEDGYKPMAELIFAFGGAEIIHWDDIKEREAYMKGINAYTIMCNDRAKFPFEKYVVVK